MSVYIKGDFEMKNSYLLEAVMNQVDVYTVGLAGQEIGMPDNLTYEEVVDYLENSNVEYEFLEFSKMFVVYGRERGVYAYV